MGCLFSMGAYYTECTISCHIVNRDIFHVEIFKRQFLYKNKTHKGFIYTNDKNNLYSWNIIESVDSISRDESDSPLTQYITNAGISRTRYTIMHIKHHHRVLRLISNRMSV